MTPSPSKRVRSGLDLLGGFAVAAVAYVGAFLLGHQVIYGEVLVPRLDEFREVPFWWWFFVVSPVLAVGFVAGLVARNGRQLVALSAVACFVAWMLYATWMMESGATVGFVKLAIEDGRVSAFLPHGLLAAVVVLVVGAMGHLVGNRGDAAP